MARLPSASSPSRSRCKISRRSAMPGRCRGPPPIVNARNGATYDIEIHWRSQQETARSIMGCSRSHARSKLSSTRGFSDDADDIQRRVEKAYAACRRAVEDELGRQV
jgi:hypothetical protein